MFKVKENSIEEDIKNAEHFIKSIKTDKEYKEENGWHGYYNKEIVELARILEHILSDYKRVLKENDCLKNHVHYKNCIACGREFKSKRSDAKYCAYCSKSVTNKIYFANLTEEQKEKRREKVKLAMRKLRINKK